MEEGGHRMKGKEGGRETSRSVSHVRLSSHIEQTFRLATPYCIMLSYLSPFIGSNNLFLLSHCTALHYHSTTECDSAWWMKLSETRRDLMTLYGMAWTCRFSSGRSAATTSIRLRSDQTLCQCIPRGRGYRTCTILITLHLFDAISASINWTEKKWLLIENRTE